MAFRVPEHRAPQVDRLDLRNAADALAELVHAEVDRGHEAGLDAVKVIELEHRAAGVPADGATLSHPARQVFHRPAADLAGAVDLVRLGPVVVRRGWIDAGEFDDGTPWCRSTAPRAFPCRVRRGTSPTCP